jgi:DNA-binding MarR family transcriptional regulator
MKYLPLSNHRQLILLFLYEHGKINKSELGEAITSPPILNRELEKMELDGLLTITESRIGRRTYRVELTPKGRAVAEQIRRISEAGERKAMDLPDSFKLITYLHDHGSKDVAGIKEKFPGLFGFVEDMTSSGIIVSRIDSSRYPPESVIELTEKGKKIAEKIKEIEEILKG